MKTTFLSKNLKKLRLEKGMSQEYLADEARVSLRTIQRIENNESKPTGETLKRVAQALGVDLNIFIEKSVTSGIKDLNSAIIYLKQQLSKTNDQEGIKTLNKFIHILQELNEKDLDSNQLDAIESYIRYLELEKIPSISNELFKKRLEKFKRFLKTNLQYVPANYYTIWTASVGIAFAIAFAVQSNVDIVLSWGVFFAVILSIGCGFIADVKIEKEDRSLNF